MPKLPSKAAFSASVIAFLLFSGTVLAAPPARLDKLTPQNATPPAKLETGKLKACQARQDSIKKRSAQLTKLVTNMEENFDSIAQRVEAYYTNKVLPSGKTLTNYNILVSDISAKKAAVQTGVAKASDDIAGFNCNSSDPKVQLTLFRNDMQGVKQELKDYRTSIKDLIVAVHSLTGSDNRDESASPSAKPSRSPKLGGNEND